LSVEIIKEEFDWARPLEPLDLSKVTGIAFHHMAHPTAGMQTIHKWHRDRGWAGFAYNYWIDFYGSIFEGRGLNKGAGLYDPLNRTVLSIGFQGDYDNSEIIPEAQLIAGVKLVVYLKQLIPAIKTVNGHNYWQNDTSCPGRYFPLERIIETSAKIERIKDFDNIAGWAEDSAIKVIEKGIMIGDDQGFFNPAMPCTRQELAVVVSRLLELIEQARRI